MFFRVLIPGNDARYQRNAHTVRRRLEDLIAPRERLCTGVAFPEVDRHEEPIFGERLTDDSSAVDAAAT